MHTWVRLACSELKFWAFPPLHVHLLKGCYSKKGTFININIFVTDFHILTFSAVAISQTCSWL